MIGYILFIIFAVSAVATVNIFVMDLAVWLSFSVGAAYAVGAIALDGLFAFFIRRMPERWFNFQKKFFIVSPKEKKFYEKLKIRKWKDKVPELGQFTNFRKNKIAEPKSNEYLDRYLLEACYGEIIHISGMISGFLLLAVYPPFWLCFGLPVAVVNLFMNFPSYAILRYNTTKLRVLYEINRRKKAKEEKAAQPAFQNTQDTEPPQQ